MTSEPAAESHSRRQDYGKRDEWEILMEQLLPGMGSAAKEGLNPAASLTLSHPKGPLPSHFVCCLCIKQIPSQRLGRRGFGREGGMSGEQRVPDPGGLSHHTLTFPGEKVGHPYTCAWLHRAIQFSPKQLLLPSGHQHAIRKLTAGFSLRSGRI